jgi:hypothetical protein
VSREIIGMEGFVPADAVVVWGAAAVRDGQTLINNQTGVTAPMAEAARLRDGRHLYLFDAPIEVRDEYDDAPMIVVMVNLESEKRDPFIADINRFGGLIGHRYTQHWQHYVFADPESFGRYANVVADEVTSRILYSDQPASNENRELVRLALTLTPNNASLNAVRVHLAGQNVAVVERLAKASMRSAESLSQFELLLRALRSGDASYELKYEDGAAAGGGFDVDVALNTLSAIQAAHKAFKQPLRIQYPFVREIPSPRFQQMRAASAELHFVPSVPNRPLGEKVARYLSLHFLEEALRGEVPPEVPKTRDLKNAIRRIAQPSKDTHTRLSQKRLAQTDLEDVTFVPGVEAPRQRSEVLKMLGFVSGLERDYTAELALFPKRRLRISTIDNGDGDQPIGAEATRGAAFFRKPFVLSLVREIQDEIADYFLAEMQMIGPGFADHLTAIPSSVLEGAVMTGMNLAIRWPDGAAELSIDGLGTYEDAGSGTLERLNRFLATYSRNCADYELLGPHPVVISWLPPPAPVTTAVGRVLVALAKFDGRAPVSDVAATISGYYGKVVRVNNTRREVLRHPDLLEFDPDDNKVMRWTERGRSFHAVYVAAGGRTDGAVD